MSLRRAIPRNTVFKLLRWGTFPVRPWSCSWVTVLTGALQVWLQQLVTTWEVIDLFHCVFVSPASLPLVVRRAESHLMWSFSGGSCYLLILKV